MIYNISNKAFEVYTSSKSVCKHCGHTMLLGRAEKMICSYCGHYIYKNKKCEFENELRKHINKIKR